MGWASGAKLAQGIWDLVEEYMPADKKADLALKLVEEFEELDCDVMEECSFVEEFLMYDEYLGYWRVRD